MARIVRGNWGPAPFSVTIGDRTFWLGAHWGVIARSHPDLEDVVWVTWLEGDTAKPARWSGDRPAEGYYRRRDLIEIGTAFVGDNAWL